MKLGSAGVLYYLTTGTRPSWGGSVTNGFYVNSTPSNLTKIGGVRDLSTDVEATKIDASTRDSSPWKQTATGMIAAPVKFKLLHDPTDAGQIALMIAHDTRIVIACAVLEGLKTVSGVTGLWADFMVEKFAKSEPLEGVIEIDVELAVGVSAVAPQRVQVT